MHTARASLTQLLHTYARPFWAPMAALCLFAFAGNAVLLLQPAILAAILAHLLETSEELAAGAGAGVFNLNYVGARFLAWLSLESGGNVLTRTCELFGI